MLKSLEKPLFVTSLPNRGFINLASPASALSQRETPKASRESQGERGSSSSMLVFIGFQGFRLVFHVSRSVFMVFQGSRLVFEVQC